MPSLRRTVRSRTCSAAARAASAAKARFSLFEKTPKRRAPAVTPSSLTREAAMGSPSRKDQGEAKAGSREDTKDSSSRKDQEGARAKAAASEEAKGSSSRKEQNVSKAKAASEEAKGPSVRKDHGGAKAKVASEVAVKEVKQGGAMTRLQKLVRNSDGASTSTARNVSPARSDNESANDPDFIEAKRPRLSVGTPLDLKKRSGTESGVDEIPNEPKKRGRGRPKKIPRFRGTRSLDWVGAGEGSWNTAGTAVQQQQQASLTAMPTGSERKYVEVDESFDPPKALRQPVIKEEGTSYKCSVSQCPLSSSECTAGLWLFALPCEETDAELRAAWEASIEIDPKINRPLSPRVCFRHFVKTDFVSRKQRLLGLEEDAVPSIQVPVGAKKKSCSYTITYTNSSSQSSSQSASCKGASGLNVESVGENAAALPDSAVNAVPGPATRSSRSRVPQPEASTKSESIPEPKSDPDAATSSVVKPDTVSTSAVCSMPASTKGNRSTKPPPKSSIAPVAETENSTVVTAQAPPNAEVAPTEAAATINVCSVPASTKGNRSTKPPPKSSIAPVAETENSTVVTAQAPPSAEVAPTEAASTINVCSVPASTKGNRSTKPPPKSSIARVAETENSTVVTARVPPSTEVAPTEAASTINVCSVPASTKGNQSTRLPPKSSIAPVADTEKSTVVTAQAPPSAEVAPTEAAATINVCSVPASTKGNRSARPPRKSVVATASKTENTTVVAVQTRAISEVAPPQAMSAYDVGSMPASTKGSRSTRPPPTSSIVTVAERENSTVVAARAPPGAEVASLKAASTINVCSVPASMKGIRSTNPLRKSVVATYSKTENTTAVAGRTRAISEVGPPEAVSASDVGSMPASSKGSRSTKLQPESSIATVLERGDDILVAGETPPKADVVPPEAVLDSDVEKRQPDKRTLTKGSPCAEAKSSTGTVRETDNTTVVTGETLASADVVLPEAVLDSDVGSVPASTTRSPCAEAKPSIETVREMDNSAVVTDETLASTEVMPLEAASASNVGSMPVPAKCSTCTRPGPSSIAIASEMKTSTVAGQTPFSAEVAPLKTVSALDIGSVPASTKCSSSGKVKPIIATVSETDNGTVMLGETLSSTEVVPPKAASASFVGPVPASSKCITSRKTQPETSNATPSKTRYSTMVAGETPSAVQVVPLEGASASDVRFVPVSTGGSPNTKPQPESSIATVAETENSTVVGVQAPPSTKVVPQTSSSALESAALTVDTDLCQATEDCLASPVITAELVSSSGGGSSPVQESRSSAVTVGSSPVLDVSFEATTEPMSSACKGSSPVQESRSSAATVGSSPVLDVSFEATTEPMSSAGKGSCPMPKSKSTAATVSTSLATGDATFPAAGVVLMPVALTRPNSARQLESTSDTVPDSTATGDSFMMVESAEPATADEITGVTGDSEIVEDSESTVGVGLAGRDSSAPEGQPMSKAAASESLRQNNSCVLPQPTPEPRRWSASSASDATEPLEDRSSPRRHLSHSARKRAKLSCRKSSKQASNSTVVARLLPGQVNSSTVVIKSEPGTVNSEPDTNPSCLTAGDTVEASTLENPERYPSPATTLSYSSDTDEEEIATPEVFSGRLFDPSEGSYVVQREIVGERDDFGMSALFYRVSWAPN